MNWRTIVSQAGEFVWPTLEGGDAPEDQLIAEVEARSFSENEELALEEALRLSDREDERRKTAEAKAANFLLVAAALVPILTYLETSIWDGRLGTAPKWLTLLILAAAVSYLTNAVIWALRAVQVGAFHVIGSSDLAELWKVSRRVKARLAKKVLIATHLNQNTINDKVSSLKMAHVFMVRAIVSFCILLIVQAAVEFSFETGLANGVQSAFMFVFRDNPPNAAAVKRY